MPLLVNARPSLRCLLPVLLLAIAGCAASPAADSQHFMSSLPGNARVVMMPPDIRYYLMTAGGNPELHEAWTADAESAFANAIDSIADMRGISIEVVARTALSEDALRFEGLHAALGEALIRHVVGGTPLPAKDGNDISDWTMGPGVHVIREETGADYALFIHYRENQPSGSRLAFAILAAASDVVIRTGSEHGFATLVNLDSGNIEWFGMLFDEGNELREEAGSAVIAEWLLEELPLGSGSFADALEAK